jgi:outer membrane protein
MELVRMVHWKYMLMGAALCVTNSVQAVDLETLYHETITSFPGLAASSARVDAGNARARQALGSLLPQVNVASSFTRTRHKTTGLSYFNGERYSVNVTQTLFNKEQFDNKKVYDLLAEQDSESYLSLLAAVSVDLVERYVNVLSAEDRFTQIKAERKLVSRQLDSLRSQYKRQLAVLTDVLNVEARLDGLNAEKISAKNAVDISREALSELVGREVIGKLSPFQEALNYSQETEEDSKYWTDLALENNNDLKALKKKIDSAKSDVSKARSGHLPTLGLQLSAQKSNIGFENSNSPQTSSYVASLNFNIPIYNGGTTSARVLEKRAELTEAEARYEESRRKTLKDLRESYLNVSANLANIKASRRAISSAKKSFEAMEKGFKFGTVTVVDVLDSQKELHRYTIDFRQKQYDYAVNWLNLLRLSGQLTQHSISDANDWLVKE